MVLRADRAGCAAPACSMRMDSLFHRKKFPVPEVDNPTSSRTQICQVHIDAIAEIRSAGAVLLRLPQFSHRRGGVFCRISVSLSFTRPLLPSGHPNEGSLRYSHGSGPSDFPDHHRLHRRSPQRSGAPPRAGVDHETAALGSRHTRPHPQPAKPERRRFSRRRCPGLHVRPAPHPHACA